MRLGLRVAVPIAGVVLATLVVFPVTSAEDARPRLTLLPLQDRAGNATVATAVATTLREELAREFDLVATGPLRDALRRERLRDAGDMAPADLSALAGKLESELFLSVTVHRVAVSPEPQITLSAWAQRAAEEKPTWFGFRSASGLDTRRTLGRGQLEDPVGLAVTTTRQLLTDLRQNLAAGRPAARGKVRRYRGGYRAEGLSRDRIGTVAIVPFESITDRDSTLAGETVTAIARTVLFREEVAVAPPGAVHATLRRRGLFGSGELDPLGRAALGIAGGADTILTGTVEIYQPAVSLNPNPRVAYSMRLIDVENGEILWIGGLDRRATVRQKSFGRKRTYNAGGLAIESMESLIAGMLGPAER